MNTYRLKKDVDGRWKVNGRSHGRFQNEEVKEVIYHGRLNGRKTMLKDGIFLKGSITNHFMGMKVGHQNILFISDLKMDHIILHYLCTQLDAWRISGASYISTEHENTESHEGSI